MTELNQNQENAKMKIERTLSGYSYEEKLQIIESLKEMYESELQVFGKSN